jgi:Carboxypeptidase regulatory-like domain
MLRAFSIPALVVAVVVTVGAQPGQSQGQGQRPQQPARDTPAQPSTPAPSGKISGRVVTADTGRPIKRARVFVNAAELPGGRGMLTDDSGTYEITDLPAGRYTLNVSKSGFVSLSYGQRRPLQAGTPLQLLDGQQLKSVDFSLPRGGVISGRIVDEDGEAVPGAMVRVMRYQYQQGDRRLTQAGTAQTDDRGQYRVWGLMPGDYYVNALTRIPVFGGQMAPGGRGGPGGPAGRAGGPGGRGAAMAALAGGNVPQFFAGGGDDQEQMNYAPTYYPGVTAVEQARPITLGVSQEALDISFNMQLVRTSRLSGHVTNPDGTASTAGNVNLMPDGSGRGGQIGQNYGGRIQWDGAFSIANVPPGRYILRARSGDSETPQFAMQPITLDGSDIDGLAVMLSAGATLTGTVVFNAGQSPVPDATQVRITAPSTDQSAFGPQPNARVDKDGRFTLSGVAAGTHLVRSNGNLRGWTLKSVTVAGRDVTDTPIDVRTGQTLSNVTIVFTDKINEISGTITTTTGVPMPDYTVLAFPTDQLLWRPQARQIATTRPDQTGKYRLRGLPPGEYYVTTVDPAEQGEWFEPAYLDEHRAGASRLTLGDGDVKTQDFKVKN